MPARIALLFTALSLFPSSTFGGDCWGTLSPGSSPAQTSGHAETDHFTVYGPNQADAEVMGEWAERYRRDLALVWFGSELGPAGYKHPISFKYTADNNSGGGATSFNFNGGQVLASKTSIEGPPERLQYAILRHELNHLVWAYYFGHPVPRWCDEGAAECAEDDKNHQMREGQLTAVLNQQLPYFPLKQLLTMPDYPRAGPNGQNITAFYAESYSVAKYLIGLKDPPTFLAFVGQGMQYGWGPALKASYGIESVDQLEQEWTTACWRNRPRRQPAGNGALGGMLTRPPGAPGTPAAPTGQAPGRLTPPGTPTATAPTAPSLPANLPPAIQSKIADYDKRIAALEARAPQKGETGATGPTGPTGPAGKDAVFDQKELVSQITTAVVGQLKNQQPAATAPPVPPATPPATAPAVAPATTKPQRVRVVPAGSQ